MKANKLVIGLLAAASIAAMPAFGGLSLSLTPGNTSVSVVDQRLLNSQSWRIEFQIHDWTIPTTPQGNATIWHMGGAGADAMIQPNGYFRLFDARDVTTPCDLQLAGYNNVVVRVQRDAVAQRLVCELWNVDGTGYQQGARSIVSFPATEWNNIGGAFGSPVTNVKLAFFRLLPTILPDGSQPPHTFTSESTITRFAFDGDTKDSSGNRHDAVFPGAAFVLTPSQLPASVPKTLNAPAWSNWVSARAGFPLSLDGAASFSMADGSDSVTYVWQQTAGPTTLRWSSRTAAQPVVKGLIFGTYSVRLQVTDVAGQIATNDLTFGAVATDDNGVVVQANPAADLLFGPMIAFGKNPWPWEDQKTLTAATVKKRMLATVSPPGWGVNLSGTISYTPSGASQPNQTTLAVAISATATTVTLTDATKLDFSTLPALLTLNAPGVWSPLEEIRICSVAGNVLTVCYDGRAWRAGQFDHVAAAQAWAVGTNVRQTVTSGTGTKFLTDFCPAGPGQAGAVIYSAGTVSATPGSTTLTGTGTSWTLILGGYRVRVQGAHGGQPFVFFATINTIGSGTTMTLSRPWPQDADSGTSLSYSIIDNPRSLVRGWIRPDGTQGRNAVDVSSCESDTRMFHHVIFSNVIGNQTNQLLGYQTDSWFSEFGPNYYDEVLAHYAGYFRSGFNVFLNNARAVGDYLPTAPDFDENWIGIIPRRLGATGMAAAAVLDGRVNNWYTLRRLANSAIANPYAGGPILANCDSDTRETAYGLSWIALAALFDPVDTGDPNTPNQRSYWKAQLTKALVRDQGCKGSNYEFPAVTWNGAGAYTLTQGSPIVKASGLAPSMCPVVASGTIDVSNGLQSGTGNGFTPSTKIVILAKRNGQPYPFYAQFTVNSPTSITLTGTFDGDTGTYPYQIESDYSWPAFAKDFSDHANINTLYACQWVDSNTIQLDRPWQGTSGVYQGSRYGELGYGQQPFFIGIKTFAMKLASLGATGATASGYSDLASGSATWLVTDGFDPASGGLRYAVEWGGCLPVHTPRLNCTYPTDPNSAAAARTLNAEAQNAVRVAYEANPTPQMKALGDEFYGAQWGKLGGPYADSIYLNALDNDSIWQYKWLGFLFGIGMGHQWPAVRLGGVQPAVQVNPSIAFNLASAPGAASAQIVVTQPSGATSTFACNSSPCAVSADARQGAHWYRIQYLNASGAVISAADPEVLEVR